MSHNIKIHEEYVKKFYIFYKPDFYIFKEIELYVNRTTKIETIGHAFQKAAIDYNFCIGCKIFVAKIFLQYPCSYSQFLYAQSFTRNN